MAELTVSGRLVLVDDEDVDRLSELAWWITPQGYAVAKLPAVDGHRRTIGMHRYLLNDPPTAAVDRIARQAPSFRAGKDSAEPVRVPWASTDL